MKSQAMRFIASARASWQTIVAVLTPVLLCPLVFPFSETSQESKCAGVMTLMAVYWITESLPLPVTSLLPIVLCPLLGIAASRQMCKVFFGDVSFLLLGAFIIAIAIEECNLHKRLALRILMVIGVKPRRLMLGILVITAFLSMWINNTAITAMMLPITRSLMAKLFIARRDAQRELASDCEGGRRDQEFSAEDSQSSTEDEIVPSCRLDSLDPSKMEMNEMTCSSPTRTDYGNNDQDGQACQNPRETVLQENKHTSHQEQLGNGVAPQKGSPDKDTAEKHDEGEDERVLKNLDPQSQKMLKAFCLCVCYSANVGGMTTLTGSAPNMVLSKTYAQMYKTSAVTFANWLAFSLPIAILTLIGCFVWMNIMVFGFWNTLTCRSILTEDKVRAATKTIRLEYRKLGRIRFSEVVVMGHFLLLVVLWLTRDPGSVGGWADIFKSRYVSDGSTALALAVSLFIFPNHRPNVLFFRRKGDTSPPRTSPSNLNWRVTSRKFPWGILLLLGGGFSLSEASKVSGLSRDITRRLMVIENMPVWAAGLVVTALTSLMTEITSNTVVVQLLLPILREVSGALSVHPLYLMLPATVASSLTFMLPVVTPSNALVFAYDDLRVIDMIKYGAVLNLIGVSSIFLALNTWGNAIYNLNTLPDWALTAGTPGVATNFTLTSLDLSNFTVIASYLNNFTSTSSYLSNFTITQSYFSNFTDGK